MIPAVFLDRDGVLIVENKRITIPGELEIFPYAKECVEKIHAAGYKAIVITNQSGIARGVFTEEELVDSNEWIIREIGVDAVYYCPHHPNGVIPKYTMKCDCRKPGGLLFERAAKDFGIDLKKSYMIGDRASDILAGKQFGMTTVLLESGYGRAYLEEPVKADYYYDDLREFINESLNT